jgi:membrane dipeptidase
MNRRQFLRYSASWGAALAWGNMISSCVQAPMKVPMDQTFLKGLRIMDAHAHPDQFHNHRRFPMDETSTLHTIKAVKMAASSFSAVGDSNRPYGTSLSYYQSVKVQLKGIQDLAQSGKVKWVLKAADVPHVVEPDFPPGAILAIEGGDPLEGNPDRANEFYRFGVRMITLMHYRNNELGDIMAKYKSREPCPPRSGLTQPGRKVVERMQELGMVVDVAHAHSSTLKPIVEMTSKPLLDSHTSPCASEDSSKCWRYRTWKDMELVAKTGGVVCTWPIKRSTRKTFLDWAKEILEMKKLLGMDHVGLGTDGGGGVSCIDGYRDVRDLVHLVAAMQEVGLSNGDIQSYMGGNFYRVLQQCIG